MPIAPNQAHLHLSPSTKELIKKAKKVPPKRIETHHKSGWIRGAKYRPSTLEEQKICPF